MSMREGKRKAVTRVAVCGEVRAGKSTVLNALLRDWILPDNLGSTLRASVSVDWRAEAGIDAAFPDAQLEGISPQEAPEALRGAETVTIRTKRQHLRHFALREVHVTTAEDLTDDQIEAIRACDVLVWVTIASQAWRLTERKILDELEDARPGMAILAISRADKLRSDLDRAALMDRVKGETSDYFDEAVFIHGARPLLRKASRSRAAWEATGGAALAAELKACRDRLPDRAPSSGAQGQDTGTPGMEMAPAPGETCMLPEGGECMFRTRRFGAEPLAHGGPAALATPADMPAREGRLTLQLPEFDRSLESARTHTQACYDPASCRTCRFHSRRSELPEGLAAGPR